MIYSDTTREDCRVASCSPLSFVENVVKIDRKMIPLFLVLLNLLAVGHATKNCWEHLPEGTCRYINDPCPAGSEDCSKSYACPVSTNKCCCPSSVTPTSTTSVTTSVTPSVPPSVSTAPPTPKPRYCWEHSLESNCEFKYDPCPRNLTDCSQDFVCPLSTNKCCCP